MIAIVAFFQAASIGFSMAAAVSPTGLICALYTLEHGFWAGLSAGLGAAIADASYGIIVGLELFGLSEILFPVSLYLRVIGGLFLGYFGLTSCLYQRSDHAFNAETINITFFPRAFLATFLFGLTNAITILMYMGIFSSLGAFGAHSGESPVVVAGIFCGAMAWWALLAGLIAWGRPLLSPLAAYRIRRIIGIGIALVGLYYLLSAATIGP